MANWMSKPAPRDVHTQTAWEDVLPGLVEECPTLLIAIEGTGDPRKEGTPPYKVTLFVEDGRVKVAVADPYHSRSFFHTLKGNQSLGELLEALFATAEPEWKSWKTSSRRS